MHHLSGITPWLVSALYSLHLLLILSFRVTGNNRQQFLVKLLVHTMCFQGFFLLFLSEYFCSASVINFRDIVGKTPHIKNICIRLFTQICFSVNQSFKGQVRKKLDSKLSHNSWFFTLSLPTPRGWDIVFPKKALYFRIGCVYVCNYPFYNKKYCLLLSITQISHMLSRIFLTIIYEVDTIIPNSQIGNLKLREEVQILTTN